MLSSLLCCQQDWPLALKHCFCKATPHLCCSIWRGKVGRAPPASHLLEASVRNAQTRRVKGTKGLFILLARRLSCLCGTYLSVAREEPWIKGGNHKLILCNLFLGTHSVGVIGYCKWMGEAGGMWGEAWAVLKSRLCLLSPCLYQCLASLSRNVMSDSYNLISSVLLKFLGINMFLRSQPQTCLVQDRSHFLVFIHFMIFKAR